MGLQLGLAWLLSVQYWVLQCVSWADFWSGGSDRTTKNVSVLPGDTRIQAGAVRQRQEVDVEVHGLHQPQEQEFHAV